jgi:hypothetical protein
VKNEKGKKFLKGLMDEKEKWALLMTRVESVVGT